MILRLSSFKFVQCRRVHAAHVAFERSKQKAKSKGIELIGEPIIRSRREGYYARTVFNSSRAPELFINFQQSRRSRGQVRKTRDTCACVFVYVRSICREKENNNRKIRIAAFSGLLYHYTSTHTRAYTHVGVQCTTSDHVSHIPNTQNLFQHTVILYMTESMCPCVIACARKRECVYVYEKCKTQGKHFLFSFSMTAMTIAESARRFARIMRKAAFSP